MNRIAWSIGIAFLLVVSCKGQAPEPAPATSSAAASTEAPTNARCPDELVVTSGTRQTPEGTLFLAYQAALGTDDDAGFDAFRALWQPAALTSHIRDAIWPRVREHVGKYVTDAKAPAITVCRRQEIDGGRVKIFVKSNEPTKSDPPSILVEGEGGWLIDIMTP